MLVGLALVEVAVVVVLVFVESILFVIVAVVAFVVVDLVALPAVASKNWKNWAHLAPIWLHFGAPKVHVKRSPFYIYLRALFMRIKGILCVYNKYSAHKTNIRRIK